MSIFEHSILTNAGAELARAAKAGSKKIVFTRAIASSNWDKDRADLSYKGLDWFNGASGSVSAVSTSGHLSVEVSFSAVSNGNVPVKSVALCAQLKKDGVDPEYDNADDIIFAVVSDENSCFVNGYTYAVRFDLPTQALGQVDAEGFMPNGAGLQVVSFTAGEAPADGVLQIKLANGKIIDIAANEHVDEG